MTTHTLRLEILPEGEPYVRYRLVCSDSGGDKCAESVIADDCKYLDDGGDLFGPNDRPCDDLWFEDHHYHHGPVGSGCAYVTWFDADPDVSWEATDPIDIAIPVDVSMTWPDEPLQIAPIEDDEVRGLRTLVGWYALEPCEHIEDDWSCEVATDLMPEERCGPCQARIAIGARVPA